MKPMVSVGMHKILADLILVSNSDITETYYINSIKLESNRS